MQKPRYSPTMRPERLNPLFAESASLKGVGPNIARPLEKLGLTRVKDLAYHLPDRFVQRRAVADLDEASVGENIIVALTPLEYRTSQGRGPMRVLAADAPGNVCAVTYFGRNSGWGRKQLPLGEKRWVAGRLDRYGDMLQIVHPDHVGEDSAALLGQLIEPVYPLSEGLTQGRIAALVAQALGVVADLPEWIEPGLLDKMKWPSWRDALSLAHKGEHEAARDRLAYDELLANSLALMLVRNANRAKIGTPLTGDGQLRSKLHLPFALTGAQQPLDGRDRGGHGASRADAAAAAGRCRLGQDGGGAGGLAGRGRGGGAGGLARADRNPRAAALRYAQPDGRGNWRRDCLVYRARQGPGARIDSDGADRRQHPDCHWHPCDLPGGGRLQEPGDGGDRRAAPLRRRPAADADAEGQAHAALPGDDRDPDPAHADSGRNTARWTSAGSTKCRRGGSRSTRGWSRWSGWTM